MLVPAPRPHTCKARGRLTLCEMGEGGARTHCKLVKRTELSLHKSWNFFFRMGLSLYGIVAEWSKATALGAVLARGAGSNPADITNSFCIFPQKNAIGFFVAIKTAWTGSRLLPSSQHSAPKPLPSSAGRPGDADMWTLRCSGQCSAAPSPQCLSCVHPNFPNQGVHERRRAVLSGASQRRRGARRGARSFQEIGDALQSGLAPSSHGAARSSGTAALLRCCALLGGGRVRVGRPTLQVVGSQERGGRRHHGARERGARGEGERQRELAVLGGVGRDERGPGELAEERQLPRGRRYGAAGRCCCSCSQAL